MKSILLKLGKRLKKYSSMILKSKYDRAITEELVETYIDARYYNSGVDDSIKIFYRRIYDALKKKAQKMIAEKKDDREAIENCLYLFQYFFYFDFVRSNIPVEEVVDVISEKRISKFNLRPSEDDNFSFELKELVRNDMDEVLDYIDMFDTDEFLIEYSRINAKATNVSRVEFDYNFDFPEIFNRDMIEETFVTDIIAEDKLFVEYSMVTANALREVLAGNFKRVYVVDFATSLFSKAKKLEQIIEIINNPMAQEKILLEVKFHDFMENKNNIFKLMKRGFKFCLKTSGDMKQFTNEELQLMNLFSIVVVDVEDTNKENSKVKKAL